ncbi:uncharacterized protein LOC111635664 [Centruroides sculpturatus]|uniref:uncharacterized protein LOC111635664 n=1 Tax=Centruroides sculpturatus TaxID=218467 RepID=UPI000C6DF634|nr:uncharacterized protein LOC111635664 [Centruroides sculpturatus]
MVTWKTRASSEGNGEISMRNIRLNRDKFDSIGKLNCSEVIWSGNDTKHEAGVGFLLSKIARVELLGYNPVSARLMMARFEAKPFNISVKPDDIVIIEESEETRENIHLLNEEGKRYGLTVNSEKLRQ